MTQVTGRWKNQYAYEAQRQRPSGLGLSLHPGNGGGQSPAWYVVRYTGFTCKKKWFSFSKCKSGAAAYRSAVEYSMLLSKKDGYHIIFGSRGKAKSGLKQNGLPFGVTRIVSKSAHYFVVINPNLLQAVKQINFSVAKYGEEQAKALAIAQREAWEEEFALKPADPVAHPRQPYENNYEVIAI